MSATMESVMQDALVLPPDQRLMLADMLWSSVEEVPDPDAEAAWHEEILARIECYDAGLIEAIPGEEVFAELRRELSR